MKSGFTAAAAAILVGAQAQNAYPAAQSYTTTTVDSCPTESMETMVTVTDGVTVTYCPECEMAGATMSSKAGYTTVYTTTYESLCPTGLVAETYTVTESCTEPTPTWTPGPKHIPQGFTVTQKECTVCASTPTTVTITEPCGCEAHEGTQGPPQTPATTTPAAGSATPVRNVKTTPTPAASSCNGADCGGSYNTNPSPAGNTPVPAGQTPVASPPYPSTSMESCPGPNCRAKATGALQPGISYGNNGSMTPAMPPTGAAAPSLSSLAFVSSSVMTVIVAALAFAL